MKRSSALWTTLLLFVVTLSAFGQDYPTVQVFGGYSHLSATVLDQSFDGNGAEASLAINPRPWLGVVGEVGLYHNYSTLTLPQNAPSPEVTFLFGPKVNVPVNGRFSPFAQALFGGVHLGNIQFGAQGVSSTAFAMGFGGGLDAKLNRTVGLRLVQLEVLRSHFHGSSTLDNWQNSLRISTGVVFRLD